MKQNLSWNKKTKQDIITWDITIGGKKGSDELV